MKKEMVGLVVQGGGTRGAFAAGVIDTLLSFGIEFPYVIGTSAGALCLINYISQDIDRNKTLLTKLFSDKRFLSVDNWIKKGCIFDFDYLFKELPSTLPFNQQKFEEDKRTFIAVATCIEDGKPKYFNKLDSCDFFRCVSASASLPLFSKPINIEGRSYLDGGTVDPLPFRKALDDGCQKVVIIQTREKGFRKDDNVSFLKAFRVKTKFKGKKAYIKACLDANKVYNKQASEADQLEKEGNAFIIRPESSLGLSRTEKDEKILLEAYEKGVDAAKKSLDKLRSFLGNE